MCVCVCVCTTYIRIYITYSGMLFSNKNGGNPTICDNMAGT